MRKLLLATAVAVFGLGFGSANATVNIDVEIDKLKVKRVFELVLKLKLVHLQAFVFIQPEKFAESDALFNQVNGNNQACGNCAEKKDEIISSISHNTGITTVNQAAGNMNNQGNVISVAVDAFVPTPDPTPETPGGGSTGFAESMAGGEQVNGAHGFGGNNNDLADFIRNFLNLPPALGSPGNTAGNIVDTINILFRTALLDHSVNHNVGLTLVNQAAGNMNNQANAISLAIALVPGVALSESDLGQFNSSNSVTEREVIKNVTADHSINHNIGVTQVNSAAGNMANQANVLSVAAAI